MHGWSTYSLPRELRRASEPTGVDITLWSGVSTERGHKSHCGSEGVGGWHLPHQQHGGGTDVRLYLVTHGTHCAFSRESGRSKARLRSRDGLKRMIVKRGMQHPAQWASVDRLRRSFQQVEIEAGAGWRVGGAPELPTQELPRFCDAINILQSDSQRLHCVGATEPLVSSADCAGVAGAVASARPWCTSVAPRSALRWQRTGVHPLRETTLQTARR